MGLSVLKKIRDPKTWGTNEEMLHISKCNFSPGCHWTRRMKNCLWVDGVGWRFTDWHFFPFCPIAIDIVLRRSCKRYERDAFDDYAYIVHTDHNLHQRWDWKFAAAGTDLLGGNLGTQFGYHSKAEGRSCHRNNWYIAAWISRKYV